MIQKKCILYSLILFFIVSNIAIAQSSIDDFDTYKNNYNDSIIYLINTHFNNVDVTKGEDLTIGVFIDGEGTPDVARFQLMLPSQIMEEHPKIQILNGVYPISNNTFDDASVSYDTFDGRTRMTFLLPELFFYRLPGSLGNVGGMEYENTLNRRDEAPIMIDSKIKKSAKAGDYEARFVLFYSKNGLLYSDQTNIKIHVKAWYEEEYGQIIIYASSILAILGVIFNIYASYKTIKNDKTD